MATIKLKTYEESPPRGEKWYNCELCGGQKYNYVELKFDSGSVEPTEGETLTGATSGDTMVVVSTQLLSGTYGGDDATGIVEGSSPTGVDDDGDWGTDNEAINGSTGGDNMMTANGEGIQKTYGIMYPKSALVKRDGKYLCKAHYDAKYTSRDRDAYRMDLDESIRSEE